MPTTRSATPASSARRCRIASALADESMTVTAQPCRANGTARVPLPPPTSSTCTRPDAAAPGRAAASASAANAWSTGSPAADRGCSTMRPPPIQGQVRPEAYRRAPRMPGKSAVGRYGWPVLVASVLSLKGGVGKTTVTLGLASEAVHSGLATLLVDIDPQINATATVAPELDGA